MFKRDAHVLLPRRLFYEDLQQQKEGRETNSMRECETKTKTGTYVLPRMCELIWTNPDVLGS